MFTNIEAVLFDLDGTLIDSAPDLGAAADRMRVKRGMPSLPLDMYRPMAGAGARGMLRVGFDMTSDHADFEVMREEFFQEYERDLTANTVVFDQVTDMLQALEAAGLKWGVVTNKSERFTLPIAQQMPLFAKAAAVVSGDTTPHAKPHPAPLLEAAKRVGVAPQRCVYVGDDERDIVAGLAAGMHTVAALYGYLGANANTASWGAHAHIEQPTQLLGLLNLQRLD
jgi:N-acetyl-D-muramate 6-phosphate phosphatase